MLIFLVPRALFPQGVEPDELEKAHRDARNYLEGTLSVRPTIDTLQDKGYLEVNYVMNGRGQLVFAVANRINQSLVRQQPLLREVDTYQPAFTVA